MAFYNHTLNWVKGEIFEALCIGGFGLILMFIAIISWKWGASPQTKALWIPFLVLGLILSVSGIGMYKSNQNRLDKFPVEYQENPEEFRKAEKLRVETFQNMYVVGKFLIPIFFISGFLLLYFAKNNHLKAVGVALTVWAISIVFIDYFSKERADIYYNEIMRFEKNLISYDGFIQKIL